MPVDTTHNSYDEKICAWEQVEDCIGGQRAVKSKGDQYLAKLSDQSPADFEAYLKRAVFFNATKKAHRAWVGMVFRKPVAIEKPPALNIFDQDCDLRSNDLGQYIEDVAGQVMSLGRAGTLVDWNEEENRPYFAFYNAKSIINWKVQRIGGRQRLALLVIQEKAEDYVAFDGAPTESDEFADQDIDQWRVYRLVASGEDGNRQLYSVVVTVYRKSQNGDFVEIEVRVPTRRGIGLPAIPFVFHNAANEESEPGEIPLEDISDLNLAHFWTSADLENGRHIAGIPTPWARGFTDDDDQVLTLGANKAWVSDESYAEAGFLEFSGQGLGSLEKSLVEKETQMAALGVRAIAPEQKDAEAFETVKMRATAETSSLATMAKAIGRGMTDALKWAAWWVGTDADPGSISKVKVDVNTDFLTAMIDPAMLTALNNAYLSGTISFQTLFNRLQDGEVYEDLMTVEKEMELIKTSMMLPAPDGSNQPTLDDSKNPVIDV